MTETKVRILDAAEKLIAEHGLDVSLRSITAEAGVNLAAVNYHFQSKDALIDSVIARRIGPVNEERLKMLAAMEKKHSPGSPPLEDVLRAFLAPVQQLTQAEHIPVLLGRFFTSPDDFFKRIFVRHLSSIADRFNGAFERAVPELNAEDRAWSMLFTIGAMVHVMTWSRLLPLISHGAVGATDPHAITDHLVKFTAAGFRAALDDEKRQHQGRRHA